MARKARFGQPGIPVLVHQGTSPDIDVFHDQTDLDAMQFFIAEAVKHRGCEIHAYGFLANQLWLVLTPVKQDAMQKMMQSVSRRYAAHFFNRYADLYPQRSVLWGKRYRCVPLEAERYLIRAMCYVENRIERGVHMATGEAIARSSVHQHGREDGILLVKPHLQYQFLADTAPMRMNRYRTICEKWGLRKCEKRITTAIEKQLALGFAGFVHALEVVSGIRLSPGKPGRPKKYH